MDISVMLKALGEPTRLSIFQQLLIRKHCVRSLSKKLGITESAISQHMKVLKEAGLVYGERFGYHIHYLPKQEALDELCAAFFEMKQQSIDLCRDPRTCQCEFRERGEK
jgi:ArsR family transcriptional regulator